MPLRAVPPILLVLAASVYAVPAARAAGAAVAAPIELQVDATDLDRHILRVHERIPVTPGRVRLLKPQWIPGTHSPTGRAGELASLQVRAGDRGLAWRRDPLDMFAFEVDVPEGVAALEVDFDHLSPVNKDSGRVVMTAEMLNVEWNDVLLYQAGLPDAQIAVRPALRLPEGWGFGTALPSPVQRGARVEFGTVSVETLIDSPVFAGRHFARFDLDPEAAAAGRAPVHLDVIADRAASLAVGPAPLAAHRALVQQADRLFGARHFAHYDFLLSVSEEMGGTGLEHHQSSENGVDWDYFVDWAKPAASRDLLSHEFVHSWNGKHRRPADLATPDTNTPMQDSLLWVYEGQTQYWGSVLAARSGLVPLAEALDVWASRAAWVEARPGRAWRDLQDTTNQPIVEANGRERDWPDWQREADYYDETAMIWLEADMRIRERSNGTRSLDDVAKAFFGPQPDRADADLRPSTYRFDDIVAALAAVQPFDWRGFLRERLDAHRTGPLLDGLRLAGWRLAWGEEPNAVDRERAERHHDDIFGYSLGFDVDRDGKLRDVRWNSPAFEAGLTRSLQLVAVDGMAYNAERLRRAITSAKGGTTPIELLVRDGDRYRSVRIRYAGGLRYPKLERIDGTEDRLSALLAPKP